METLPAVSVLSDASAGDLPTTMPPAHLIEGLADLIGSDTRRDSTKESYASDVRAFESFATASGHSYADNRPVHPLWVAAWVVRMREKAMALATIERRVRGLGADHRSRGLADPTSHPVVTEALKKLRKTDDRPQKQAHALRAGDIRTMTQFLGDRGLAGKRNKAMVLVGFSCALRVSEFANLRYEDVAISEDRIALTIRKAKTANAESDAQHVAAASSPNEEMCPVLSLRDWVTCSGINEGPIFRGITRHQIIRESAISTRAVGDIVKRLAKEAGIIGWADVSSHSLRRGWASEAAMRGVPSFVIKQHGRWKTDASAARYVDAVGSEAALAATRAVMTNQSFADAMAISE